MRWTVTFDARRPWLSAVLIAGVLLAVVAALVGLMMLPGLLFGTRLEPAEAEAGIRGRMLAEVAQRYQGSWGGTGEERAQAQQRYEAEIERIRGIEFASTDVDTSVFSAFRMRQSFVVKAVIRQKDGIAETRYYCFLGTYLTGDCATWNWYLAW